MSGTPRQLLDGLSWHFQRMFKLLLRWINISSISSCTTVKLKYQISAGVDDVGASSSISTTIHILICILCLLLIPKCWLGCYDSNCNRSKNTHLLYINTYVDTHIHKHILLLPLLCKWTNHCVRQSNKLQALLASLTDEQLFTDMHNSTIQLPLH